MVAVPPVPVVDREEVEALEKQLRDKDKVLFGTIFFRIFFLVLSLFASTIINIMLEGFAFNGKYHLSS